jgi:hypothetical protein
MDCSLTESLPDLSENRAIELPGHGLRERHYIESLEGDVIVHVLKQAFYLKKPSMTEQRARVTVQVLRHLHHSRVDSGDLFCNFRLGLGRDRTLLNNCGVERRLYHSSGLDMDTKGAPSN